MNDNRCIRILADPQQIKACKEDISRLDVSIPQLANVLSLTGNEVRLKILFLLYKETQMCPCDLSDVLDMTVPAISQHLRKLKDGGLVKDKKVGQTIFYSVIHGNVDIILPILNDLIRQNQHLLAK